ncbi:MAG: PocR ligand-binding domain-containing protein [Thermacetogeniaceae bacterium]
MSIGFQWENLRGDGGAVADLREHIERLCGEELQRVLRSFTEATGMSVMVVDRNGRQLMRVGGKNESRFCRIIQSDPVGFNKCCGSYARAGREAAKFGETYIFRCHAGLVAFAAPLLSDGEHIGSLICGQVLMWEPEDFFWEEIAEMTAGLNVRVADLMAAAREMEVVSGRRVQAAADMLFAVANQVMKGESSSLVRRKESILCQARIFDEISSRKQLENKLKQEEEDEYTGSLMQLERELRGRISLHDREGSFELLNKIVAEAVERYVSQPRLFRARMLELAVSIFQAAVEAGGDEEKTLELFSGHIEELVQADAIDAACACIYRMLDDLLKAKPASANLAVIEAAKRYIQENFHKSLTLNDIARAVYISPYYLSHIFKEHMNCTVIDYLTRVRIEEAKKLLRRRGLSIVSVARRIGYSDSGYFSKVFKKAVGVTPSAYKRQVLL